MENDLQPLVIYKNKQEITNTQQLPIPHQNRICTDLFCTVFTGVFAVAMLVMAIISFDLEKLKETTYPTDIDGRLCTKDNDLYNYLYFTSPTDPRKRLCVSQCPTGNQTSLKCLPSDNLSCHSNSNPQFQVSIYPSTASDTKMGLFCMPVDERLKQTILSNNKLKEKFLFVNAYKAILYSAFCSIGLGLLFLLLVSFMPETMTYIAIIVGGIGCIGIGVMLFVVNSQQLSYQLQRMLQIYHTIKIIFSVLIIIIGILCLLSLVFYGKDLKICISFLKDAGNLLTKALILLLFIFMFYLLMVGLIGLMLFQILAYWSHGEVQFHPQGVHKTLGDTFSTIMLLICGIEFFWGMAFLKESFNFLISGNTVYFYFKNKLSIPFALGNLFKFHWGSVVAGSFLLDFFYIFDVFYDFMKPRNDDQLDMFNKVCCCCDRVLGLARSDTFSFLNIVGQPYCNSARYCQQIDDRSNTFEGSQSVFRFFRIGSHVMLSSLSTTVTYLIMQHSSDSSHEVSVLGLILSFIINLFVVTFFVSLIAQIAEAVSLCKLVESYIKNENQLPSRLLRNRNNLRKNNDKKSNNGGKQDGYTIHETNS